MFIAILRYSSFLRQNEADFEMNARLHRKQIIMLILALLLAAASFWIPLPQQHSEHPTSDAKIERPQYAVFVRAFNFET